LRYGVLEGPEHGVYVRGIVTSEQILLPDYWSDLIHEGSITIQLTPIGKPNNVYVSEVSTSKVTLKSENGEINHYFFIQAERKDIDRFLVEYKSTK